MLHLSQRYPCHTISLSTLLTASWYVVLQVTVDTRHLLHESQRLNSMGVRPREHGADSVPYMLSTCQKIMQWDRHGPLYGTPAVWSCSCGIISHTHIHAVNKVGRDKVWQILEELKLLLRHPPCNKESSYWTPADKLYMLTHNVQVISCYYLFLYSYNIKQFLTHFGQYENVMWTERGGRKLHVRSSLNGFNIIYE